MNCFAPWLRLRRPRNRRLFLEPLEDRSLLAAILTVNSTADTDARDAALTLREAIEISNGTLDFAALTAQEQSQIASSSSNGSNDTIAFNIPGSGVHTIGIANPLPIITAPVIIDGYTQPGSKPNTAGPFTASNAVLEIMLQGLTTDTLGYGLRIDAGNSTVQGLIINAITGNAIEIHGTIGSPGNNVIAGNWLGLDASGTQGFGNGGDGVYTAASDDNVVGGTSPTARNVIAANKTGVEITNAGSERNKVLGNFIGTDPSGSIELGNQQYGVRLYQSHDGAIGGYAAGSGNLISASALDGIWLSGPDSISPAKNNLIAGNRIGTDVTGTQPRGNLHSGIALTSFASDNIIGGDDAADGQLDGVVAARNIISANGTPGVTGAGILMQGAGVVRNLLAGNIIGANLSGAAALGNLGPGIHLSQGAVLNQIGGATAGAGNIIAFNNGEGILHGGGTFGVIQENSIFGNFRLGINLVGGTEDASGVTANDAGDADSGPEDLQNYPALTGVAITASGATVRGTLNSEANTNYRIEFFASASQDSSGFGEGQTYVGAIDSVTTDNSGNASFVSPPFLTGISAGQFITATALRLGASSTPQNTSEFSRAVVAGSLVVTNTNDSGHGSLRDAIALANALPNIDHDGDGFADPDVITFNIPGTGVHTITPATALPAITDAVVIDGYSQPGASPNTDAMDNADPAKRGSNGTLLIELSGAQAPSANGLLITGSGSTIRGLVIGGFSINGIYIVGGDNNIVAGNYIGTDTSGSTPHTNVGTGLRIDGGASGNTIGTNGDGVGVRGIGVFGGAQHNRIGTNGDGLADGAERNVISGNTADGVGVYDAGTSQNVVAGNYIGTDITGTVALGNVQNGIATFNAATANIFGGLLPAQRNIIAGNQQNGVFIGGGERRSAK